MNFSATSTSQNKSTEQTDRVHGKGKNTPFFSSKDVFFNPARYIQPKSAVTTPAHTIGLSEPKTNVPEPVIQQKTENNNDQTTQKPPSPVVQRVVELRPPGRGEASAFNRAGDIVDRINAQSDLVRYSLDANNRIVYEDIPADEVILNPFGVRTANFDQKMKSYIDRAEVVPMRLITSAGFVGGGPLLVDSLQLAYVDVDDLLGSDDLSFQLNLIHILTERFGVRNYERRIGTNMPEFDRVHRAGLDDEAEHLREVVGDPTIRFNYEEPRPNGSVVFAFRSDEGYRIFHVFRGAGRSERSGDIFVGMPDGRRLTVDQLRAERAAAAGP